MGKFNFGAVRAAVASPVRTTGEVGVTEEGGAGYFRDTKSELFLLAVVNMVRQTSYYEAGGARDERYVRLVRAATVEDAGWTARFLKWLRGTANMRSASLVGAAEFAKARLGAGLHGMSRQVVDSVLQRADEPGEMLAYWTSMYGRAVPKPVKRGIADAVARLYDERSVAKWNSDARAFRFGDVLELTHPVPRADWQGELFRHLLDVRHGHAGEIPGALEMLRARAELMALPVEERRGAVTAEVLRRAGMTWEALAGWLQGPMDAAAWEAVIPSMGYMALLRNLRNFDQAGVSDEVAEWVAARLADPERVARSRQFPMRFLSAYRAAPSLRWGHALEKALAASLSNVPELPGRTLVVIDRSPSMFPGSRFSTPNGSDVSLADQAAVFGCAVAMRAQDATVVVYGGKSRVVDVPRGGALLRFIANLGGVIAYTDTAGAVDRHYRRHDRVVIITDEQSATAEASTAVPQSVPVYVWNIGGYRMGNTHVGLGTRHTFGGLTDAAFRMVPLLEAGRSADWPF
ncbi:TROVE domain-containing protein [Actinokineospora sp. G85]|uniref:TROVE domain-containing protein n=1 Tax=Actinokineospora sp. G85 TaxID=3406626 RepID=UPI003C7474B3